MPGKYGKIIAAGALLASVCLYDTFKADIDPNYLKPKDAVVKTVRTPGSEYRQTELILHFNGDVDTIPLTNENVEKIIKAIQ